MTEATSPLHTKSQLESSSGGDIELKVECPSVTKRTATTLSTSAFFRALNGNYPHKYLKPRLNPSLILGALVPPIELLEKLCSS